MKKVTFYFSLLIAMTFSWQGISQVVNQSAAWPNAAWTVTGTYNADPTAFEADPTLVANFAFDDDDAGNGSDDDIAAESPVIDLTAAATAGETWISISGDYIYNKNGNSILQFEYWDADNSMWTIIGAEFPADTAGAPTDNFCGGTSEAYTTTTLDIAAFTATQLSGFRYRIYYNDDLAGASWAWGFCFTSPTITSVAPPLCPDPSVLAVANIGANNAGLSWMENGTATMWNIELVDITAAGAVTGTATSTGVTNPFTQTGLMSSNDYEFYVQSDCGGGDVSAWVGPFAFTTACSAMVAPYTQDFENAGTIPSCWTMSGGENWLFNTSGPNNVGDGGTLSGATASGNYYAVVDASGTHAPAVLLSSFVDVSGLTTPALSFYEISNSGASSNSQLDVEVWDGAAWNTVGTYNTDTTGWEQKTIDLSSLTITGDIQAKFTFSELVSGDYADDIAIDDVMFAELPVCADPSALAVANITANSADFSWTENGTATMWNFELVDVTAGGTVTGTATTSGIANPYGLSGLTANNAYEYYIQSDCGGYTSAWVGPFAFNTPCETVTAFPFTEDFEDASTTRSCWSQTYVTGTGDWTYDVGSSGGTIAAAHGGVKNARFLSSGTTQVTKLVSPTFDLTTLANPELTFWYGQEDWAGDQNELKVYYSADAGATWVEIAYYTADISAWTEVILTLPSASATYQIAFEGYNNYGRANVIDDVTIAEVPTCPDPTTLAVANMTTNSADLSWMENGSATSWNIELVDITAAGAVTGTATSTGVTNPFTQSGLMQGNDYEFYVQSDCGGGDVSAWVGPFAFTTTATCPAPSTLDAANITETSADLSWLENGSATMWNIELVDLTAGNVATGVATATGVANPYAATGLMGDNAYEFYVQSDCGGGDVSAWVGPFAFVTPYVAVAPDCTSGIFLDSGGANANYSSGENITYTICPDNANESVSVTFSAFSSENNGTGCYDGLTIHDGANDTAVTIDPPAGGTVWCWDRNDATPGGSGDLQGMTITSSDVSGCLTFVFTSDSSVSRAGWEATVSCSVVSVDDMNAENFTYYPNPVNNDILVLNSERIIKNINVTNVIGQEVLKISPNSNNHILQMHNLKTGVYFVKVLVEGGSEKTLKIIKD